MISRKIIGEIAEECRRWSIVSPERMVGWVEDVARVIAAGVPGSIVEAGVYHGGCVFAAAMVAREMGQDRRVVALDTFAGMTEHGAEDVDCEGVSAGERLANPATAAGVQCCCPLDDFFENARAAGVEDRIMVIPGDIRKVSAEGIGPIAALRVDVDWKELVGCALDRLGNQVMPGGIIHVDDYGHWSGAGMATDQWMAARPGLEKQWLDKTGVKIWIPNAKHIHPEPTPKNHE